MYDVILGSVFLRIDHCAFYRPTCNWQFLYSPSWCHLHVLNLQLSSFSSYRSGLIDQGSTPKGVFREEPMKLDTTKVGIIRANQYWDTQQQLRGLSWPFLFTHNENVRLQTESWPKPTGLHCSPNEKELKICCLLMAKLIPVPVCHGSSTVSYISPCSCLQPSCCYVHCYLHSHHSWVNTLSHLLVLLEFNLCSS